MQQDKIGSTRSKRDEGYKMRFCFNGRINPNLRKLKIRSAKQTKK